ncbi:MAG: hypothetical protein M3R24_39320 [Chloroflexota bacterium]|nr:hypothetical protein [Chloroflexota bacterium]
MPLRHTPTPWWIGLGDAVSDHLVAQVRGLRIYGRHALVDRLDDAKYLIHAVNSHGLIIKALRDARRELARLKAHMQQAEIWLSTDEEAYARTLRRIERAMAVDRGELAAEEPE